MDVDGGDESGQGAAGASSSAAGAGDGDGDDPGRGPKRLRGDEGSDDEQQPAKKAKTGSEPAAFGDRMAQFKQLVDQCRNSSVAPEVGELFEDAAFQGELQQLKHMVAYLPELGVKQDCAYAGAHDIALAMASESGHTEVVEYLLELGIANVRFLGAGESTALENAAENGHAPIVRLLLKQYGPLDTGHGEDEDPDDGGFNSAVRVATTLGLDNVLLALVESDAWAGRAEVVAPSALLVAAARGRDGAVRLLLKHGPTKWSGAPLLALEQATKLKNKAIIRQLLAFDSTLVEHADIPSKVCMSGNAAAIEVFTSAEFWHVCEEPIKEAAQICGLFNHTEAAWSAVQDLVQGAMPRAGTARRDDGSAAVVEDVVGVILSCCDSTDRSTSHRKLCYMDVRSSLAKAIIRCLGDGKDAAALFGGNPTQVQRLLFMASVLMRLGYKQEDGDDFWIDFTSDYDVPGLEPETVERLKGAAKGKATRIAEAGRTLIDSTMKNGIGDLPNYCAKHDNAAVSASSSSQSEKQETLEESLRNCGFSVSMTHRIATIWREAKGDTKAFWKALQGTATIFSTTWWALSVPADRPSPHEALEPSKSCEHFFNLEKQLVDREIERMLGEPQPQAPEGPAALVPSSSDVQ